MFESELLQVFRGAAGLALLGVWAYGAHRTYKTVVDSVNGSIELTHRKIDREVREAMKDMYPSVPRVPSTHAEAPSPALKL
jgi:hypothetical protein